MEADELESKRELNALAAEAFSNGQSWESAPEETRQAFIDWHDGDAEEAQKDFAAVQDGLKYFMGGGENLAPVEDQ
jgi:hypothetical protein